MNDQEKTDTALKSLIVINNDRYEGYKTAAEESKDMDLKSMFTRYSMQSKGFNSELYPLLRDKEEAPEHDETTHSGKLYRVWMDLKAAVTAQDRKGIIASCEFGEDVALKTYKTALEIDDLAPDARQLISKHKDELQQAHDTVKSMRDHAE